MLPRMRTPRTAKARHDLLRRKPGKGPGPAGVMICRPGQKHGWDYVGGGDKPTLDEYAFIHRNLAPRWTGAAAFESRSKREYGMMTFSTYYGYGKFSVSRPDWSAHFYVHGSPQGWRYKEISTHGSIEAMRTELAEIDRILHKAETDFPHEMKAPKGSHIVRKAKAWCQERYADGFLKHNNRFRFKNPEQAFEFKINWL